MQRNLLAAFYLLLFAFLGAFFLYPLASIARGGFFDESGRFTLEYLAEVARNPLYREGLANAFGLAAATTLLSALLALPLALLSVRYRYPGKALLSALILAPLILPPFVGAIGLRQFWGQAGVLNALLDMLGIGPKQPVDWLGRSRFWGVVIAQALHLYPILYLNAAAALANIDPALDEAARNMGAGRLHRFTRVTLPLAMPGLFAGGVIVFIWSFTELGTSLMFDYTRVTAVQIFDGIKEIGNNPLPYVLVIIMLAASALLYALSKWALGGRGAAMMSKAATAAAERPLRGWRAWAAMGLFVAVCAASLIPHICVAALSLAPDWYATLLPERWTLAHYESALSHAFVVPSIANSLRYAGASTLLDLALGFGAAWIITRSTLPGRAWLDALVMGTLAVPGLVLAFGYLAMTQPGGWFHALDPTEDPTILLIIAYAIRRLPYVMRAVAAGLEQTSVVFEEAARNLGARPLRVLRKITLPLISANLIAGAILAFCFAMLEVADSLMLAQKQAYFPITKAMFELFQLLGEGPYLAAALGVWCMLFLGLGLYTAAALLGRKMGALFRV